MQRTAKTLSSSIDIYAPPERIWESITNVDIEQFSDPLLFRLLDIPKPLKAELLQAGPGGRRVAYLDSGKRFVQVITVWQPGRQYSFTFNPEPGFRVLYFFDIAEGVFQMNSGSYLLTQQADYVTLNLQSTYSVSRRFYWLLKLPVELVLQSFQRYLLRSIKAGLE